MLILVFVNNFSRPYSWRGRVHHVLLSLFIAELDNRVLPAVNLTTYPPDLIPNEKCAAQSCKCYTGPEFSTEQAGRELGDEALELLLVAVCRNLVID